jgi:predicted dienelactone hydrolase
VSRPHLFARWLATAALLSLLACSSTEEQPTTPAAISFDEPGARPVGHERFTLEDTVRGRSLQVQVWYPAAEGARAAAAEGVSLPELLPEGADRDTLGALVAQAPERCTSRRTRSAPGVAPADGVFPVVVFSHCSGCLRFSSSTVAERLASHGIAVVAPDHAGGTLFDALAGQLAAIGDEFLGVRAGDLRAALDAVLDPAHPSVPEALRGRFDGARVGVMGHSYGAATAGKVLQEDPRFRAGFAMAAPPAFLGGVEMTKIQAPVFLLLAGEDNSIGAVGNNLIRSNYKDAPGPAWLAEVADAGHWSFSDICALTPSLQPGCGEGKRQSDKSDFTYLDIDVGRGIAAGYAAAFFAWTLLQRPEAEAYLSAARPEPQVTLSRK